MAISLTPESAAALTWAIQNLCRSGDAVHIVHVVTCLSTPSEVRHCGPAYGTLLSAGALSVAALAVAVAARRQHLEDVSPLGCRCTFPAQAMHTMLRMRGPTMSGETCWKPRRIFGTGQQAALRHHAMTQTVLPWKLPASHRLQASLRVIATLTWRLHVAGCCPC